MRHAALFGSIVAWARYGTAYVASMTVGASAITSSALPSSRATTACSPDSNKRMCSASSSAELRRSASESSHSTVRAPSARAASIERLSDDCDAFVDHNDCGHPGLGQGPRSSTEATLAPNRGGWSTTALSMPGTLTSIVKRVVPRIFGTESTRSLAPPISA